MATDNDKDKFKLPNWIGCPQKGSHLDVVKGPKLIQKLLIDEKGYYYFGRNPTDCDFVCEHASCSRVHAVLLHHKILKRFALVDLESSHGTFIDNVRIPALSPVFLDLDQCFHFGASTRRYFLREKLITNRETGDEEQDDVEIESGFSLAQTELDNVTDTNTIQNRRIPQIPQTLEEARRKMRNRPRVQFNEEEDIINPEDVDPSVGRFRNMVRTAVIPTTSNNRRQRDSEDQLFDFYSPSEPKKKKGALPSTLASSSNGASASSSDRIGPFASSSLGSLSLNAAPDLELYGPTLQPPTGTKFSASAVAQKYGPSLPTKHSLGIGATTASAHDVNESPTKKKYAKEAWPKDMRRRSNTGVF